MMKKISLKQITLDSSRALALSAVGVMLSGTAVAQQPVNPPPSQDQSQLTGQAEQSDRAEIRVQEQAPQIQLQQPATNVTVDQAQTQVEVATDRPEVRIEQPDPKVTIDQPEPEISIQQAEMEVVVNEAEPEIEVRQAEPEVTVNPAEPEVEVVRLGADGEERETRQAQASQSLLQVSLDDLKDKTVVNNQGEELGDVDDVVVSREGNQRGFVVSVGGFLGIGENKVFVPADEVSVTTDNIIWETSRSKEQLEEASNYQEDRFESVSDQYETLGDLEGAS